MKAVCSVLPRARMALPTAHAPCVLAPARVAATPVFPPCVASSLSTSSCSPPPPLAPPAASSSSTHNRMWRPACVPRGAFYKAPVLPNRQLTTAAGMLADAAARSMTNGLLDNDDYYRNGVPHPKFSLSKEQRLSAIFSQHRHVDPFVEVEGDLRSVSDSIRAVVGSDHPILERVASYFFDIPGKRIRPTIVLLMSRAMSLVPAADASGATSTPSKTTVIGSQQRLSEITEMIHTASLLHDDVIDEADTRRGRKSVNAVFGNKLAILGGDFLLARASVALSRLRNCDAVELMSNIIEHLVKGEIMQMKGPEANQFTNVDHYITKSFYKTASLMANSCRSAAVVAGHTEAVQDIAYEYGRNVGVAFQIIDDLLDFVGDSSTVGKPVHHDLQSGLATLPVIYAAEQFPEVHDMMARKFKEIGDVERVLGLVERSEAIEKARRMAITCAESAVAAVLQLPPSGSRSALIALVEKILDRDR